MVKHLLATIAMCLVLGACTASTVNSTPASQATGQSSSSPSPPAKSTAHTGATINISGTGADKAAVTLVQIIDPATGANQFASPDAGKRLVGTKFQIANAGSGTLQDDANNDASLQGSDGQSYTEALDEIAGCTNFSNGSFTLAPGASVVGCVVYQLPTGVTVAKVQFNVEAGFGGQTAEWLNP